MRGKAKQNCLNRCNNRITPAHAGKSLCMFGIWTIIRDHPRTCGEKMPIACSSSAGTGSPPHMRGKVKYYVDTTTHERITPAHAGKSLF